MDETIYTAEHPGDFAEAKEKHIPVLEIEGNKVRVKVGGVPHPMEPTHYIEWVALLQNGAEIARQNLAPEDAPVAEFEAESTSGLKAREHCNIHGTWEST